MLRVIPLVLLLVGCASANHYSSWVGHPESELLARWGVPNRGSAQLPDGRTVHTYNIHIRAHPCRINVVVGADGVIQAVDTHPPSRDNVCYDAGVAGFVPPPLQ